MNDKIIEKTGQEEGFAKVARIHTSDIDFVQDFRIFCEQNQCGNYGKNYACPPYCGTPQEMEDRARQYRQAIVFQSRTKVKDIFDEEETKALKRRHTSMTLHATEQMCRQGLDRQGLHIMCGPCTLCSECLMPEGKPCPREEGRYSCLSAYGINATTLAKHCGMEIEWNGEIVSFFSLYLFDRGSGSEGSI